MPDLPPVVWIAGLGTLLVILAMIGGTLYGVLRAASRARIREWPGRWVLGCALAALIPWIAIALLPLSVRADIHSVWAFLGWLFVALLTVAVTVIGPLAALLIVTVWLVTNHHRLFRSS